GAGGEERRRCRELVAAVVHGEADLDLLHDRGQRHDRVGLHAHTGDDDPSVHADGVDRRLDHPGQADALEHDVEAAGWRARAGSWTPVAPNAAAPSRRWATGSLTTTS